MKKITILAVLFTALNSLAQAATSPALTDYLTKLSLCYYSPVRQGLSTLNCEVHSSAVALMIKGYQDKYGMGQRVAACQALQFFLSLKDGKPKVSRRDPYPRQNMDVDSDVNKLSDFASRINRNFANSWTSPAGMLNFSADELAQNDYSTSNTATGFNLTKAKDNKSWVYSFNKSGILTKFVYTDDMKPRQILTPTYLPTKQGMILNTLVDEEPEEKTIRTLKFTYQFVGAFQLPAKVSYSEHSYTQAPGVPDLTLDLTFDGYSVNQ